MAQSKLDKGRDNSQTTLVALNFYDRPADDRQVYCVLSLKEDIPDADILLMEGIEDVLGEEENSEVELTTLAAIFYHEFSLVLEVSEKHKHNAVILALRPVERPDVEPTISVKKFAGLVENGTFNSVVTQALRKEQNPSSEGGKKKSKDKKEKKGKKGKNRKEQKKEKKEKEEKEDESKEKNGMPDPIGDGDEDDGLLNSIELYLDVSNAIEAAKKLEPPERTKFMAIFLEEFDIKGIYANDWDAEGVLNISFGESTTVATPLVLGWKARANWLPRVLTLQSKDKFKQRLLYAGKDEHIKMQVKVTEMDTDGTFTKGVKAAGAVASTAGSFLMGSASIPALVPHPYAQAAAGGLSLAGAAVTIAANGAAVVEAFVDDDLEFQALQGMGPVNEDDCSQNMLTIYSMKEEDVRFQYGQVNEEPDYRIKLQFRIVSIETDKMRSVAFEVKRAVFKMKDFKSQKKLIGWRKDKNRELNVSWSVGAGPTRSTSTLVQPLRPSGGAFPQNILLVNSYPIFNGVVHAAALPLIVTIARQDRDEVKERREALRTFLGESSKTVSEAITFAFERYQEIQRLAVEEKLDGVAATSRDAERTQAILNNRQADIKGAIGEAEEKLQEPRMPSNAQNEARLQRQLEAMRATLAKEAAEIERLGRLRSQELKWRAEDLDFIKSNIGSQSMLGLSLIEGFQNDDLKAGLIGLQSLMDYALETGKGTKTELEYSEMLVLPEVGTPLDFVLSMTRDEDGQFKITQRLLGENEDPITETGSYMHICVTTKAAKPMASDTEKVVV